MERSKRTIERIEEQIESIKVDFGITEMDPKNIDRALETWVVEKFQNKLKEKGLNHDEE